MEKKELIYGKEKMIKQQMEERGIHNPSVLQAMKVVPREAFVPSFLESLAYEDTALPIEEGQTISQPYIVALMTESLKLQPEDRVLEVGTGCGYAAAVLSKVAAFVYTMEYFPELAKSAKRRFQELGYSNIFVLQGDGFLGWPENAPYAGISVAAASSFVPPPLLQQLTIGGHLVMPIEQEGSFQELMRVTRQGENDFSYESLGPVRFVPLLGQGQT